MRRPNIALSATSPSQIPLTSPHTLYIPPHPQRGTPYHRYVLLLLPQPDPTTPIKVPVFTDKDRLGFNFRAFAQTYGFDGAKGGGAHMFREVWDETVSQIYEHVLSTFLDPCAFLQANELTYVQKSRSPYSARFPRLIHMPKSRKLKSTYSHEYVNSALSALHTTRHSVLAIMLPQALIVSDLRVIYSK